MNESLDFIKNNRGILVHTGNPNIYSTTNLTTSRAKNRLKRGGGLQDVGRGIVNLVLNEGSPVSSIAAVNQITRGALINQNKPSVLQSQVSRSFGSLINETVNQTRSILPNIQRISDLSETLSGIAVGDALSLNGVARRLVATSPELANAAAQIQRGIGIAQDVVVGGIVIAKAGESILKFLDNPGQIIKNLGQEIANFFPNLVNLAIGMISNEVMRIIREPMRMAADVVRQFYELQDLVSASTDLFGSVASAIKKLFSGQLAAKEIFAFAKKSFGEIANSIDIVNIIQSEIQRFANFANYIKQISINKNENEKKVRSIIGG